MAGGKDLSGDVGNRYDNAGRAVDDPTFPPPYRPSDASPSCLYPSLQMELRALQMADLDLDSRPPPAACQPANLPASQPRQLASPLQHQPVSEPTHPPAVQADLTEHNGPSGAEVQINVVLFLEAEDAGAEVGEGDSGPAPMLAITVESLDTGGMNVLRNCSSLTVVTDGGRTGPWIWLSLALRRGLLRSVRFHKHTHSCMMILIHIGCLQRPYYT
ncbi:hypothetical protein XENOCAPTIV_015343 [Xenoophorus captivus]|uniref:Uncharacterized protein n=1 Tax=Xenoophorus captivus TaxID=1517983 RepID=A0ABV0S9H0_9TELE